jgi:ferredoxin-thioredoxin reductase catalytic subunit
MAKRELTPEEALKRAVQFSARYVARGPYRFFPDPEVVAVVQKGLADNEIEHGYRYCP